jgi:hypothetical protein
MQKGPKWSDGKVQAMVKALRGRIQGLKKATDEQLIEECLKVVSLTGIARTASREQKIEELEERLWDNATKASDGDVVGTEAIGELMLETLKKRGTTPDGLLRKMMKEHCGLVDTDFDEAFKHLLVAEKIKIEKTSAGNIVLTAVKEKE